MPSWLFIAMVSVWPIVIANTPTPSPTITSIPTPTRTARPCTGDDNGDGRVTIDELIRAVNASLEGCSE